MPLNYYVALIFGAILVLAGVAGFLIRSDKSLTSGAPAYNIFHIIFGVVGISVALSGHETCMRVFNTAFGAIDLYQALASKMNWFPAAQFRWKKADDTLHVVIGLGLVFVGVLAG